MEVLDWAKYVLELGLRYQVGDGKLICIWEMPWLHTISTFIPQPKVQNTRQITLVRELMSEDGKAWNVELLVYTPILVDGSGDHHEHSYQSGGKQR